MVAIANAVRRLDPSGTSRIRQRAGVDIDARTRVFARALREKFRDGLPWDWRALSLDELSERAKSWAAGEMRKLFLDGDPMAKWVRAAYDAGHRRAERELGFDSIGGALFPANAKTLAAVQGLSRHGVSATIDRASTALAEAIIGQVRAERLAANGLVANAFWRGIWDRVRGLGGWIKRKIFGDITSGSGEAKLDVIERLDERGPDADVELMAEWHTVADPCPLCAPLNGRIFKLSEARGMLPVHPNCRCGFTVVAGAKKKRRQ